MNIFSPVSEHITRAFGLTFELYQSLDHMGITIPDLPSNNIGQQAWCIVGARESYLEAIKQEKWVGFSCSLGDVTNKAQVLNSLSSSQEEIEKYLEKSHTISETQISLLFDLLEHEIQHHGQLIRFLYANKIAFPKSWNKRYTV